MTAPRVLLVNQYFWPDIAATAQLLSDLAEDLAATGAEVRAVAGRGSYAGNGAAPLPPRERWQGIEIVRPWSTRLGRGNGVARMGDALSFLASAAGVVLFGPRADVVVCLSTPPMVGLLGLLASLRGARFVYKVEDLYPDIAVALGKLRHSSWMGVMLSRVSSVVLKRADLCIALDDDLASSLRRRGARRIDVIPNWADGAAIRPDDEGGEQLRRDLGLADRFVVLYSGNHGLAHRFDAVLEAAERLAGREQEIGFLFVGDGPRRKEVVRAAARLSNFRLLPYQPRERLGALYAAGDLHLVSLRDEVSGLMVPSKYAAALAAGRPVLLVGGAETGLRREIEREAVGWCCHHDAEELERAVREAARRPAEARNRGRRGRALFDRRYDRALITARWVGVVGRLAGNGDGGPAGD